MAGGIGRPDLLAPTWDKNGKFYPGTRVSGMICAGAPIRAWVLTLRRTSPAMPPVHLVSDEEVASPPVANATGAWRAWGYLAAGAALLAAIGTWLVWFSASLQHRFQEEDIRAACQRAMPDQADRCFDTVVIQRGGVRR